MKTIKANQTIAGGYGVLSAGQTADVADKVAADLEKAGLATIEGSGEADKEEEKASSITISDNSSKEKKQVISVTEKKDTAGPNDIKKK